MEAEEEEIDSYPEQQQQKATYTKAGKPPPIVLTSAINLILFRYQLKGTVKDNFEFRSTRNRIRIDTRKMQTIPP
jgi:hypothetical protein